MRKLTCRGREGGRKGGKEGGRDLLLIAGTAVGADSLLLCGDAGHVLAQGQGVSEAIESLCEVAGFERVHGLKEGGRKEGRERGMSIHSRDERRSRT
jgi:hypothetical protein